MAVKTKGFKGPPRKVKSAKVLLNITKEELEEIADQ
jgi:hypothetical protein